MMMNKLIIAIILISILALLSAFIVNAFSTTTSSGRAAFLQSSSFSSSASSPPLLLLHATGADDQHSSEVEKKDDEIERLKSMAAKLRAEAAALEAEQAEEMAAAAKMAFEKFDKNQDGEISLQELKSGLEKAFKTELPENRVQQLLDDFDKSGDGALQPDEFVTVDKLRNKLEALARDEKAAAREAARKAKIEDDATKFAQAQMEVLNDRPPTPADRFLSVLPYLFPLLDGFQFAKFIVFENPENPAAIVITLLYALYRSIPFGGFVAFISLSFLSGNPTINRLIRFNMQQAIFLDIALIVPGLAGGLYSLIQSSGGVQLPQQLTEIGSDAVFFTLLATLAYACGSSLLGQTPDKIPFISDAVNNRMPTYDMFDDQGRFIPQQPKEDEDDDKKKD